MDDPVPNLVYLISRYVHIVATTLLLGGTLFYETVVPVAIGELRDPQQLSVFARARWMFKGIVWISAALILLSGAVTAYRNTYAYFGDEVKIVRGEATTAASEERIRRARLSAPGWWAAAHSVGGLITVGIALMLVSGRRPPERPIGWMRVNLLLLLIVIFLASTSHYLRLKRVLPSRSVTSADVALPPPNVC